MVHLWYVAISFCWTKRLCQHVNDDEFLTHAGATQSLFTDICVIMAGLLSVSGSGVRTSSTFCANIGKTRNAATTIAHCLINSHHRLVELVS